MKPLLPLPPEHRAACRISHRAGFSYYISFLEAGGFVGTSTREQHAVALAAQAIEKARSAQ